MDTVMFLTIVLAVTSQFLVKSVTPGCPPKCSCEIQSDSCIIDCTARLSEVLNKNTVFVTSLSDDINNILSTMNTTLRRLIVRNCTLLEDVPLEVCNMRLLQSITLRNIGLKRLPENCFARLPDLVSLEADHNSIVTLQVSQCYDKINVTHVYRVDQLNELAAKAYNSSNFATIIYTV